MKKFCERHYCAYDADVGCLDCCPEPQEKITYKQWEFPQSVVSVFFQEPDDMPTVGALRVTADDELQVFIGGEWVKVQATQDCGQYLHITYEDKGPRVY